MKRTSFLLCLLFLVGCSGPKQAQITAYDQITLPNEEATLQVKVRSKGLFGKNLKNKKVSFFDSTEKKIGEGITQKNGTLSIRYTPTQQGFLKVEARLHSEKYSATPSTHLLRVAKPDTKFLVVDIDNTISDISPILMLVNENINIPPVKGAPETLQQLSKEHTIIYMTGRDDVLSPKTKAWLKRNGFPEGPVFFWDFMRTPLSKKKYKSELIELIGRKFQLIQIGIGNSVGDAAAYIANGLQAIILLSPEEKNRANRLPRGAKKVNSWQEIQQLLY